MSVGENIKKRRVAKGLSQAELAGAIGVGQSYLSQIEDVYKRQIRHCGHDIRRGFFLEYTDP